MTSIPDDLYYFSVEPSTSNFDLEEAVIELKKALEPYTVPYLACQVTEKYCGQQAAFDQS